MEESFFCKYGHIPHLAAHYTGHSTLFLTCLGLYHFSVTSITTTFLLTSQINVPVCNPCPEAIQSHCGFGKWVSMKHIKIGSLCSLWTQNCQHDQLVKTQEYNTNKPKKQKKPKNEIWVDMLKLESIANQKITMTSMKKMTLPRDNH